MTLKQPTPIEIVAARETAGLTQAQAAELVHLGAQPRWAEYENGTRPIDLARWELFLVKTEKARRATIDGAWKRPSAEEVDAGERFFRTNRPFLETISAIVKISKRRTQGNGSLPKNGRHGRRRVTTASQSRRRK